MRTAANFQSEEDLLPGIERELRALLRDRLPAGISVTEFACRPSPYRTSFALSELDVHLSDGSVLRLMIKRLGRDALHSAARETKPHFLHDPLREIETYRLILQPNNLAAPRYYGTCAGGESGEQCLVVERVAGLELYQLDPPEWIAAARWLASTHERFRGRTDLASLASSARLLRYDDAYFRLWPARVRSFAPHIRRIETPARFHALERIMARYDVVVERLATLPQTLVHGEFFASNVLIQQLPDRVRVCPVDWEMAGIGPGLIDLAALVSGDWSEQQRSDLARAYYDLLPPDAGPWDCVDGFQLSLDACRVHTAMQWLGWAQDWTPPPENTHDWLGTLVELAERLNL